MCFSFRLPERKAARLEGWDYRWAGIYFVTVCAANRRCLFGEVVGEDVELNAYGRIVDEEWRRTAEVRPDIVLGEHVVMPNHVHGLVSIGERTVTESSIATKTRSGSLGAIIGQFKANAARRINLIRGHSKSQIWQRGYFDRIVRNDEELQSIREYIATNPARWAFDRENPGE
jgi:REP element-mobilizing transposase RayT